MLYHLLLPFAERVPGLGVVRYITFRTAAASLTALALSLLLGPWLIRRLRAFQIGQVVRQDGPASHKPKAGTPTMGGLLILTAVFVPTLLWADLSNVYIWIAVIATALFGVIGFVDDYLKVTRHSHYGLFARYKFAAQIAVDEVNREGGINGAKLELVTEDNRSSPEQAVIVTRNLESKGVFAMLGPIQTTQCRTAFPAANRAQLPTISPGSSAPGSSSPPTKRCRCRRCATSGRWRRGGSASAGICSASSSRASRTCAAS